MDSIRRTFCEFYFIFNYPNIPEEAARLEILGLQNFYVVLIIIQNLVFFLNLALDLFYKDSALKFILELDLVNLNLKRVEKGTKTDKNKFKNFKVLSMNIKTFLLLIKYFIYSTKYIT